MCGRGACTLSKEDLSSACGYQNSSGKYHKLQWINNNDLDYVPSCNIAPKTVIPCIAPGKHFSNEEERILCPMVWGIIPPWHKGDYRKHTTNSYNSRLERSTDSKLLSPSLRKGFRCVVILDGYYEWKISKNKSSKKAYYIYPKQEAGIKADDPTTWSDEWSSESGWKGYKPLKMAGMFNKYKTAEGQTVYSCSILTTNASKVLSWLHDRAPVVLSEENCEMWLDLKVPVYIAIEKIKAQKLSEKALCWHPVSTLVNNVFYKEEECRKEINAQEERKSGSASFMASWLQTESGKSRTDSNEEDDISTESETEEAEMPTKRKKRS